MGAALEIDGSEGEGGGQILRTSMALSAITGTPVRIGAIRAGREKPGLMRQHLAAVRAAAEVCGGKLEGAELGSQEISFAPGEIRAGEYRFATGSAGSTTLVLQTVLPMLLRAGAESTVTLEGGTHNPFAPPADFLEHAFLPLVRRMGAQVGLARERYGFYPAGGGRLAVRVVPGKLGRLELSERGEQRERLVTAVVADLSGSIAMRELEIARKLMALRDEEVQVVQAEPGQGPGNAVMVRLGYEHVTEVFTAIGERGRSAESVAEAAVREARAYAALRAPVGEHLADQLLLPMALGEGGAFLAAEATPHATTNVETIRKFLPVEMEVEKVKGGVVFRVGRK